MQGSPPNIVGRVVILFKVIMIVRADSLNRDKSTDPVVRIR